MINHGVKIDVVNSGITLLSVTMDYKTFNTYYDYYQSVVSYGLIDSMLCFTIDLDDFASATNYMKIACN